MTKVIKKTPSQLWRESTLAPRIANANAMADRLNAERLVAVRAKTRRPGSKRQEERRLALGRTVKIAVTRGITQTNIEARWRGGPRRWSRGGDLHAAFMVMRDAGAWKQLSPQAKRHQRSVGKAARRVGR